MEAEPDMECSVDEMKCPDGCVCDGDAVDCSATKIKKIPSNLPVSTTYLLVRCCLINFLLSLYTTS